MENRLIVTRRLADNHYIGCKSSEERDLETQVQTLNKHFRNLTQASFQRYGFAYGELLARWPAIVGDELAGVSKPERIKWPRGADGRPDRGQPDGGTLVVRVAEGRGLEIHYQGPRIIERINGFYGYSAIAKLKILQGQLAGATPNTRAPSPPDAVQLQKMEDHLNRIGDDKLRAALKRLGNGALSKSPSARKSPQS